MLTVIDHRTGKVEAISGRIGGFTVRVVGSEITVEAGGRQLTQERVPGLQEFLTRAKDLRLGLGQTEDFNIIYLYDAKDDNFGYAVNVEDPDLSEWGYAPL